MKRMLLAVCACVCAAGTAWAQGARPAETVIDLAGHYASTPDDPYGGTFGYGFGVNTDLSHLGIPVATPSGHRAQLRVSATNNDWHETDLGVGICYRRIPFFVGLRYSVPLAAPGPPTARPPAAIYGELGPEASFDTKEMAAPSPIGPLRTADARTRFGVTPGIGVETSLTERAVAGLHLGIHLIHDPYWTLGLRIGYRLGR